MKSPPDFCYAIGQSGQKTATWKCYIFNLKENAEITAIQNFQTLLRRDPFKAAVYAGAAVILKVDTRNRSDVFPVVEEYPITFED